MADYTVLAGDPAKSALNKFLLEIRAFSILQEKPKKFRIDSEWPETERNWKKKPWLLSDPPLKKKKNSVFFLSIQPDIQYLACRISGATLERALGQGR